MLIRWYFENRATRAFRSGKNSNDKWDGADADIVAGLNLKVLFYVQAKLHVDITSSWAVEQVNCTGTARRYCKRVHHYSVGIKLPISIREAINLQLKTKCA